MDLNYFNHNIQPIICRKFGSRVSFLLPIVHTDWQAAAGSIEISCAGAFSLDGQVSTSVSVTTKNINLVFLLLYLKEEDGIEYC